ncbi:hypothetical protein L596_024856 [Steinernema carpocapsae]|uniref:Non-specific protein-tyrosine kinase n=1 Tax=Steinernema carpocapsae TaxID=34508 RepID=A0A4U5M620_STECR|nr:hypothetical protein L596_024856 [Steinernema carpocapsae]
MAENKLPARDPMEQSSKKVRRKSHPGKLSKSFQRKLTTSKTSTNRETECEQSIKKAKKKSCPTKAKAKTDDKCPSDKEISFIKEIRVKKLKKDSSEAASEKEKTLKKAGEEKEDRTKKSSTMTRCEHAWPQPADAEALKDTPKPWKRPMPQPHEVEWYYTRMPTWYIEEKMLRNPGDFLVSREHSNKMRLSIMTNEPGNPMSHHPIEFTLTRQVKHDRNFYYRIVGTVLQANSIWNLIEAYQKSQMNILRHNLNRDVELLNGVLPCLGCLYGQTEYSFHYIQIKAAEDLVYGEQICKGETSTIYKATRYIRTHATDKNPKERPVLLKELDEYNEEVLDQIYREMHIVNTIRHKIGWNTVLNIEAIMCIKKPYVICYKLCKGGSLMQFFETHKDESDVNTKLAILEDLACTMYQIIEMGILHCDLSARNVFVDLKDMGEKPKPIFYISGFRFAVMAKTKKVDPNKIGNARFCAPEVHTTETMTEESEVFSFALLMCETLSGELPFKSVDNKDIKQVLRDTPELRPEIPDSVPKEVAALICEAYSGNPEKRPKMKDLWRRLRNFNKDHKKP